MIGMEFDQSRKQVISLKVLSTQYGACPLIKSMNKAIPYLNRTSKNLFGGNHLGIG
jgi:hypothetical protein